MIITNITSKDVTTKFGVKQSYTVEADGKRFAYGLKKPVFTVGDDVEFQMTTNAAGYENVDVATVRVITKGAAPATSSAPTARPSYGPPAKVFPIPALHGDRAIVRQNSLTNAVQLLREDKELAKLTSTDRANHIINIARMFEAYSCGDLDAEEARTMMGE
jgi:hypothetical protein